MMVQFSNVEVPVWKLRAGTVVAWEMSTTYYGHILSIIIRDGYTPMIVVALNRDKHIVLKASEITWVEPH